MIVHQKMMKIPMNIKMQESNLKICIKGFFSKKTWKYFKNSKKFGNFYKSSIKIIGNLAFDEYPESIEDGENIATTISDKVEMFNNYFKNLPIKHRHYGR